MANYFSFCDCAKMTHLFRPFIFFIRRSCPCGSDGISFMQFGGQDVENEHGEVTRKAFPVSVQAYRVIRKRVWASLDGMNFGPKQSFSVFILLVFETVPFIFSI